MATTHLRKAPLARTSWRSRAMTMARLPGAESWPPSSSSLTRPRLAGSTNGQNLTLGAGAGRSRSASGRSRCWLAEPLTGRRPTPTLLLAGWRLCADSGRSSLGQSDTVDAPHPQHSHLCIEALGASGKTHHKPDQIATIMQPLIVRAFSRWSGGQSGKLCAVPRHQADQQGHWVSISACGTDNRRYPRLRPAARGKIRADCRVTEHGCSVSASGAGAAEPRPARQ